MNIGHNNPPDPRDEIISDYADFIDEAETWLDGSPVENEDQMKAVDDLRKAMRQARLAATAGQKSEAAPLHDAWKAALAKWKPIIDDFKRIEDGLVAIVGAFKTKLAAEKRAAEKAAWEAAEKARREAEAKAAAANAADIEAQREAAAAAQAAIEAEKAAKAQAKDTVKGMRNVWKYEVTDYKTAINWIVQNDRDAVVAFIDEYARRNHRGMPDAAVKSWQEKEAF